MLAFCLLVCPVVIAISTSSSGYKTLAAFCLFHVSSLKADNISFQPVRYLPPDIKEVCRHEEMKLAFMCSSHRLYKIQLQKLEKN